ncbi:EamA family transporter [Paraburkholderia kururiensis]|uniref:EamA family transporter n=1 Tax=Paraburkholderia kururiensis TaxID=984307 RepID=A0ABZ0WME7_9BURK|nr:EamA family transporter [Paraburkholderia kururiensis]WQD78542.1 EamA family transporter [Paraburkholderia kururiensis]
MKAKDILLAIFVTAIWGANFSVIKLGLASIDPFLLAGIRFALCAIPAVFVLRRPQVSIGYLASYGLLFGVGLWGIVNLGIQAGLSAGIASLVLQFSAFFTILLGSVVFKESISRYQYAGIAVALGGLASIITITDGSVSVLGVALVVIGALSWSSANIIIKRAGTKDVLAFLVWSSLFSPIPLFAIAWLEHGAHVYVDTFSSLNWKAVFSILFQVYPTTLFGYWAWNRLLKTYPVSRVAPLSLLVPIFGMIGSVLIFGEHIGAPKIAATALIVLGLTIGLYGKHISSVILRRAQA